MVAIIDYGMGNLRSVENALTRLGAEYVVTADPGTIAGADKVLLPGVGNAAEAMENLRRAGLVELIRGLRKPVLGICVGLQVMCRDSEEGNAVCMNIFDSHVRRFEAAPDAKVPHMGWNTIGNLDGKLFRGMKGGTHVYFVHSYYPSLCSDTIATCRHGNRLFSAALKYENFYGTQFHPEKSGDAGERILANFLAL
ncbi:MAG: imidazole glycerol phosphate synthase subunit HisH [Bacteroidales bacterium]|nr:imidazole glycerol phosphate synthase subunit HisH [Bacteroidales bacterium]